MSSPQDTAHTGPAHAGDAPGSGDEAPQLGMTPADPGFDLAGGAASAQAKAPEKPVEYQVLARKYRPRTFDDLIGQEAMVRTLRNAFASGRIAHAFILTGVRGIGKTTTARILARALNYEADGTAAPLIDMPGLGVHCQAIMDSRHPDVLEMDAASRTGIDDIREIIESVRYAPNSARYKVYIIDEVHMLSKAAFNGLLKTLEEPPPHVKFIFATTEIRKVPVTVLSRCQRFDLRRLDTETMTGHLGRIAAQEDAAIDEAALALIARAAEGSVRDGLSLLDQAIAHGAGSGAGSSADSGAITAEAVRDMLGLADRGRVFDLFEHVVRGNVAAALEELRSQYQDGADPAVVISDMAELTHWLTRLKLVEDAARDVTVSEMDRTRGLDMAAKLPVRTLARTWQMLLKGLGEVERAPWPLAAAEMVLVRLAYAADLPSPDEVIRKLDATSAPVPQGGGAAAAGSGAGGPGPRGGTGSASVPRGAAAQAQARAVDPPVPAPDGVARMRLAAFEDVVALAHEKRDIRMAAWLENDAKLVSFAPGQIKLAVIAGDPGQAQALSRRLQEWTGERWFVTAERAAAAEAQPTLAERRRTERDVRMASLAADPLVKVALETFPGAEIVEVRDLEADALAGVPDAELPNDDAPGFGASEDDVS